MKIIYNALCQTAYICDLGLAHSHSATSHPKSGVFVVLHEHYHILLLPNGQYLYHEILLFPYTVVESRFCSFLNHVIMNRLIIWLINCKQYLMSEHKQMVRFCYSNAGCFSSWLSVITPDLSTTVAQQKQTQCSCSTYSASHRSSQSSIWGTNNQAGN